MSRFTNAITLTKTIKERARYLSRIKHLCNLFTTYTVTNILVLACFKNAEHIHHLFYHQEPDTERVKCLRSSIPKT